MTADGFGGMGLSEIEIIASRALAFNKRINRK
jgi:hypothetical protein